MSPSPERSPELSGASALVTGGAGFIGSHLVEGLLDAGAERVIVVDDLSLGREANLAAVRERIEFVCADCADARSLERACGGRRLDLCFNLAVIPLPHSLEHPRKNVDRNVAMTTAVCELQRGGGFDRLVQFSSSEVYGSARSVPMSEDHPLGAHTPYAAAKAATDLVALSYGATFGLDVLVVRPFNTYGERQNDTAYAGLIPLVVRRVLAGEPVIVNGDGEQTRDMMYVADTIRGTLALAVAGLSGETYNLGTGEEASVNEMVRALLHALDAPDHPVEHGPPRPGDIRQLLADASRARAAVGFEAAVGLDEGLRRTVRWYLSAPAAA
ncbi:MAG: GDP-mannose 4,6-dehydratase [Actinomycetota bacterium]|nr:GDP-mannose 4,6-dehydratase [Actinomycetota bacterium]